jgi:hypothetical protein
LKENNKLQKSKESENHRSKKRPKDPWVTLVAQLKTNSAPKVNSYSRDLRGTAQNRFGGHQTQRLRGFKGSRLGPANAGRLLKGQELQAAIEELKKRGDLD